jgi:hypothetical protein
MKKKSLLIIVGIISVIILLVLLIPKHTYKLKTVTYPDNNLVINRTDRTELDTIFGKGLEITNIKGERFVIQDMPDNIKSAFNSTDIEIFGATIKKVDFYLIYLKPSELSLTVERIAHELMHVKQYMSGQLKIEDGEYVVWEQDTLLLPLQKDYLILPWELDARKKTYPIYKLMEAELLTKE